MSKIIEGGNKGCKNCGGSVVFSPSFQCLVCEKCGSKTKVEKLANVVKHAYSSKLDNKEKTSVTVRCENCGANVIIKNSMHSAVCNYCKSSVVLKVDDMQGLKPDGIIPFAFDKQKARVLFKQNIRNKWFLPNKFKEQPPIDTIKGIYIPSFAFDEITSSTYQGRLGTNHTKRDSNGHSRTYTTYQNISGNIKINHQDVFVESGSQISQTGLEEIKPFDTREVLSYSSDFIRGFSVEYYTDKLENCKKQADLLIDNIIRHNILKKYSYDFVSYLNVSTLKEQEKFSYIILPTYQVEYKYKDKKYINLMNGQTGRVGGKLPKSGIKIGFFVSAIILIIAMIAVIISKIST